MRLRTFCKKEDGAVAVIVAISMTVLFGFTALAMDYGMMAAEKQSMQNAVDAAALAAAMDIGAKKYSTAYNTAKDFCADNGYAISDTVTLSFETTAKTATVTLTKTMRQGFSAVLTGEKEQTVSATATAEAVSLFHEYPYAILAGKKIEDQGVGIAVYGNDHPKVYGSIHSNSNISFADVTVTGGTVTARGSIQPPIRDGQDHCGESLDVPPISTFDNVMKNVPVVEFSGDYTLNGTTCFKTLLDDAYRKYANSGYSTADLNTSGMVIHISGNMTFNGWNPTPIRRTYPVTLIVDGNVSLNGAPLQGSLDYPVYVISKNGNVTMSGGVLDFFGIIYAPNGDVKFDGINVNFIVSIIAQKFYKNGGTFDLRYNADIDRFLPSTKVHLIA